MSLDVDENLYLNFDSLVERVYQSEKKLAEISLLITDLNAQLKVFQSGMELFSKFLVAVNTDLDGAIKNQADCLTLMMGLNQRIGLLEEVSSTQAQESLESSADLPKA